MSKVRERILEVASTLFYEQGIQAVGVDAIITTADVARMSFYRHFRSKEGLVLAYLAKRDESVLEWFERQVERIALRPKDRPLAVFDALALRFAAEHYRGCGFINAMVELPDRTCAIHRAAAKHKVRFEALLARLLHEAGLSEQHAPDLQLLFDGAVVAAVREGSALPAVRARRMAARLLGLPEPGSRKRATRGRATKGRAA